MISLGEHSQHMKNVENSDPTKFIARYGHGHPANVEEDYRKARVDAIYDDEQAPRTTVEVADGKRETWGKWGDVLMDTKGSHGEIMVCEDEETVSWAEEIPHDSDWVVPLNIFPYSSHCDGSIYRDIDTWKKEFRIVDRRETRLEAMMLADPTDDCIMTNGGCIHHIPRCMVQIFSLKVAKIPVDAGSVELYGYIAARDQLDPLLNYVVNISRDHPIIVEKGSLINMAPKRGIELGYETLIEYDMKIKTGGSEKDDLQLIDGVSVIDHPDTFHCSVFTCRINGDCGAIDKVHHVLIMQSRQP